MSWSKFLTVSALLFFLLQTSIFCVNASSNDEATIAVTEAEEALFSVYEAVFEAERAGANISTLVVSLNVGSEYLAEAYVWYRLGDSENTIRFAGLCYDVVENIRSEAFGLMDEAKSVNQANYLMTMVGSVVGVVVVILFCSVAWRVFKRRYNKRVLGLKPEVVSVES